MNRWTRTLIALLLSAALLISPIVASAEIAPETEAVETAQPTQEATTEAPQADETPPPEKPEPEKPEPEESEPEKDAPKKVAALSFRKAEVEITLQQYAKGIDYRDLNALEPTPKGAKAEALSLSVRDKKDGKLDSSVAAFVDYDKNGEKLEGDYAEKDIDETRFEVYAAGTAYVRAALKSDPAIYAEFKLIVRDEAEEQAEGLEPTEAPETAEAPELETEELLPVSTPEGGELESEELLPVDPTPAAEGDPIPATEGDGALEVETLLPDIRALDAPAAPTETISIDPASLTIEVGKTGALTATADSALENPPIYWGSSNKGVATVSGGTVTAVSVGTAEISAYFLNNDGEMATAKAAVEVVEYPTELTPADGVSAYTIKIGEGPQLAVTSPNVANPAVIWATSDDTVAIVEGGKVTALAPGEATITATSPNGPACTFSITVGRISLSTEGDVRKLPPEGTLAIASVVEPASLAVEWTSSNPAVATVANGEVAGLADGSVTITAAVPGTNISASLDLTVGAETTGIEITGATFEENRAILYSSDSLELTAAVVPADSTDALAWVFEPVPGVLAEADGAVLAISAEVDEESGLMVAKTGTEFVVAATAGGITETRTIVLRQAAQSVAITGEGIEDGTLTIYSGSTAQLGATVLPDSADKDVAWESSNPLIAEVDGHGLLTAKAAGSVLITARSKTDGNVAGELDVIVRDRAQYITLDITYKEIDREDKDVTYTITPKVYPETATEVYWESRNPDVATVDQMGNVTAKKQGYAVIYARTSLTDANAPMAVSLLKVTQLATGLSVHTDPFPRIAGYPDLAIAIGQTITLGVTVMPEEAANIGYTITAANPSLISISGNKIKGLKTGKTTITVAPNAEGSKVEPRTLDIWVVAKGKGVTAFKLNKSAIAVLLRSDGTSSTYKLVGTSSPSNATYRGVRWYSEDPSIATVASNGTVSGVSLGTTTIHALSTSGIIRSCTVTVGPQKPGKVAIKSNYGSTLYVGQILPMSYSVSPKPYDPADEVVKKWRSTNPSVALVNDRGEVTAVSAGTATIYAAVNNGTKDVASNAYKITVKNNTISESTSTLRITAENVGTMYVNGKYHLDYEMALNGATLSSPTIAELSGDEELAGYEHVHFKRRSEALGMNYRVLAYNSTNTTIRWLSGNSNYASIDPNTGLLTAKKATPVSSKGLEIRGKSRLNSNNKLYATEFIRIVSGAAPTSVTLYDVDGGKANPATIELAYDPAIATRQLRAEYSADPNLAFDWSSSDPQVASVDQSGLVRAVGIGTATISVSPKGLKQAGSVAIKVTGETNGITYRALVIGMYQTSGQTGYMPFASNSTSLARNAIARSNVDGNRYSIAFANNTSISTKDALRDKITSTFKDADENDVSIIYLHSHGTVKSGVYRWHLKNSGSSSKSADFMTASELIDAVKKVQGHVILNVVSCNSGSDAGVVSKGEAADKAKPNGSLSVISSTDGAYNSGWLNTASSIAVDLYSAGFSRGLKGTLTVRQMFASIKSAADDLNAEYRAEYGETSISGKTQVKYYPSLKADGIIVYKN